MSVIQFDLAPERGGKKVFSDVAEAILWTQQQKEAWDTSFHHILTGSPNSPISTVARRWNSITNDLQKDRKRGGPVALTISDSPDLVSEQSPVFTALSWIAGLLSMDGIMAAATAAGLPNGHINWADPAQASAVLLYDRTLQSVLKRDEQDRDSQTQKETEQIGRKIDIASETLNKIEERIAQIANAANQSEINSRTRLNELETSVATTDFSVNSRLVDLDQHLKSFSERADSMIDNLTISSKKSIDHWFAMFKEQRQLEAPVALWEGRALFHNAALASRKKWMIGVGSIGLLLTVGVALGAFKGAEYVFREAILPTVDGKPMSIGGMRPSFHFELLLASAGTLLFLTMYLWTMRLLVRLYTTEHHLAIDAQGRAALTETYLSLTKQGAATDADRAIMLGVIFRPVADGMIKEEGPPSLSPAALIAGLASGSPKTN